MGYLKGAKFVLYFCKCEGIQPRYFKLGYNESEFLKSCIQDGRKFQRRSFKVGYLKGDEHGLYILCMQKVQR